MRTSPILLVAVLLVGCSSDEESTPPTSTIVPTTSSPVTSPAPTSDVSTTLAPSTTAENRITIECDADSGESPTFEVPLGTSVTLVATSSIEREYHLHDYDIELTGEEVTFEFTADLPGSHELTEHPDHSTVCTIVSP